jgi:16S rRNA (guanine966-N2)-methyltransferase
VIAGSLRGRTIRTPARDDVRPTYDRVRESLFAMLEPTLPNAFVLDMFAGSGSLGIEALSRGASEVVFVEQRSDVVSVLEGNIEALGLSGRSLVLKGDALRLARDRRIPGGPFDIVFVDPPYASGDAGRALAVLPPLVVAGGLVIVEQAATAGRSRRAADHDAQQDFPGFGERRRRRYGSTELVFHERVDGAQPREAA